MRITHLFFYHSKLIFLTIFFVGSRITKVHDFGYVSLDISHVRDKDEGVYMCRASNPLGEAVTTASMKIKSECLILFRYLIYQDKFDMIM